MPDMLPDKAGGRNVEFWEGAILIVGGVWLIGRVSRNSPAHPVNAAQAALAPTQPYGNTVGTQTDGSTNLVWGESLAPPLPPLSTTPTITTIAPVANHVATTPVIHQLPPNVAPLRFNPIPTVPKVMPRIPASSYMGRDPVGGKFIPL